MRAIDPISPITSSSGKEDRALGVTNDDFSKLDVKIDPHIRLNLPTAPSISQSAVAAVINAVSGFATEKIGKHFKQEYGDKYKFDHVTFEAISVESFPTGGRKLRSFEREEAAVESVLESELGIKKAQLRNLKKAENSVEEEFGTSIVLGGTMTFADSPTAPPDECNAILFQTMQRYWGMTEWIKEENQEEFEDLKYWNGISSELVADEPSVSPTDLPTSLVSGHPSASPSITNEVVVPISLEDGMSKNVDGGGRDTLLKTLSAIGALLLIVVMALYLVKRRRQNAPTREKPPAMQRADQITQATPVMQRHRSGRKRFKGDNLDDGVSNRATRGGIGGIGSVEEGTRIGSGSEDETDTGLMCSCIG